METKLVVQQTATVIDDVKCSSSPKFLLLALKPTLGNQLKHLLRTWLSPSNPSTNHIIAQKAQHRGTAAWLFNGSIVLEWKSSAGSLLWIHGKRTLLSTSSWLAPSD